MDSHTLRQNECKGSVASLAIGNERALVQQALAGDAKARLGAEVLWRLQPSFGIDSPGLERPPGKQEGTACQ